MKTQLSPSRFLWFSVLLAVNLVAAAPAPAPKQLLKLFLLVGQSNMAGRGKVGPEAAKPIPGVWSFDRNGQWIPAVDPLHWDKPDTAGVGPGRSFARELRRAHPEWEIGLIPCAFDGTRLAQWVPEGELFKDAVARTKEARTGGELCGILWHQGEADSGKAETATTYAQRLRSGSCLPMSATVSLTKNIRPSDRTDRCHPHSRREPHPRRLRAPQSSRRHRGNCRFRLKTTSGPAIPESSE